MYTFNVNRKRLSIILCAILICVFTLTIVYAALSVTLNIIGNAEVAASTWDIKFANPKVKSGSVTTEVPIISGNTLTFNTILTTPGDYYEFTVDVVNGGSIDAMIDSVTKTPELTSEQAKFLKYEITYQNGESIASKQLLAKNTTMPIKVRIEYRKDLAAGDLPSTNSNLNLSLTLNYVQSDGTGSSVNNNGSGSLITISRDVTRVGTLVTIDTENFHVFGTEGDNIQLLSMYNLYVGNQSSDCYMDDLDNCWVCNNVSELSNPTGKQDSKALGFVGNEPYIGVTSFSNNGISTGSDYSTSVVKQYVDNYKDFIVSLGIDVVDVRMPTLDDFNNSPYFDCEGPNGCRFDLYPWANNTAYWLNTSIGSWTIYNVKNGVIYYEMYADNFSYGVRPMVIISKNVLLSFTS